MVDLECTVCFVLVVLDRMVCSVTMVSDHMVCLVVEPAVLVEVECHCTVLGNSCLVLVSVFDMVCLVHLEGTGRCVAMAEVVDCFVAGVPATTRLAGLALLQSLDLDVVISQL